MIQGDNKVTLTSECSGYLPQLAADLKDGMTIIMSNWGTDYNTMSWLDQDTGCQGACDNNPDVYFYNIKVKTGSSGPSPPTPPTPGPSPVNPGDWNWGDACASVSDQDCGLVAGCTDCAWSWGKTSWSQGPDAKCRCRGRSVEELIQ